MEKKLKLNKETIASLDSVTMNRVNGGGLPAWGECRATYRCDERTGGCTDGCGIAATAHNCTDGHCTRDCTGGFTEATEQPVTSGDPQ